MLAAHAEAADPDRDLLLCGASINDSRLHSPPPLFPESERGNINISAKTTRTSDDRSAWFEGDVLIEQHELRIHSDLAHYNSTENDVMLQGNIHIDTPSMGIDADRGSFDMDTRQTSLDGIRFFIPESHLRGEAAALDAENRQSTRLEAASLTSCPPDDVDWLLSAGSIDIDLEDEYGSARDVTLRFQDIPFLYTPYIEFPIGDKRRSGLLAPEIGQSSSRGVELVVPWYWNIAPNQDATIAPHNMSKRGLQLDTQYRFLTRSTTGQLDINYLHKDKITDEERYQTQYLQQTTITRNVRFNVDYKDVSDAEYFQDFSNNLFGTSTTHLGRNMSLAAGYDNWRMSALLQSWETLDNTITPADRPHRMLPKLDLRGDEEILDGLFFSLDTEWINFEHEFETVDSGSRFRIKPGLFLDLRDSGWYFKPAFSYSHTQYNVTDGSGSRLDTGNINVPITSVEGGLFFERAMDNGMMNTLEPRLFYVNIPYRDQNSLPLFDTSEPDFSLMQLFRENRFNGGDRVGDTNQLTAAISSRIIDPSSGTEYLRATIGQVFYFDDRRITLSGTPETDTSSDIIAELGGRLRNWKAAAAVQWDSRSRHAEKGSVSTQYSHGRALFNAGYSRRLPSATNSERLEQTDLSFVAPVSKSLTAIGRWNYSLEQKRDLEVIAGLSYESCCWSVIIAAQRNLVVSAASDNDYNNSVIFQLVLKGLGNSGGGATNRLKQSIIGFDQDNL